MTKNCTDCTHWGHDLEDAFCANPEVGKHYEPNTWFGMVSPERGRKAGSPCGPEQRLFEKRETESFNSDSGKLSETLAIDEPMPGHLYRHYKGGTYLVLGVGKHTETGEDGVLYRNIEHGSFHFRPRSSWYEPVLVAEYSTINPKRDFVKTVTKVRGARFNLIGRA